MKLVTPLDRQLLIGIPSALEGKFYMGGPYELDGLLKEPKDYGDEDVDWRTIEVAQENGVKERSARVDVACSKHHASVGEWPGHPTRVRYTLRYLYRDEASSPILGAVEVKVVHRIGGIRHWFEVAPKKVIHAVYVHPSHRGRGIARILLAEVLGDAPDVRVHPQFSEEGARLFGFDSLGNRVGRT